LILPIIFIYSKEQPQPKAQNLTIKTLTKAPVKVAPEVKPMPKPSKKDHQNLWGEEPGDLLAAAENNQDWGEFVEAQSQNPPLTPKVTPSASIMEMYRKPLEGPKENVNRMPVQSFPINNCFMNNVGYTGGMMGSNANVGNNGMNMNMMNNPMMGNNLNGGNNMNMRNWNMMSQQQMMYNNNNFNNGMNMGPSMGLGGMNMMPGAYPMNNPIGTNTQNTTNNAKIFNSNENKVKNSGDIMNLYNTSKVETVMSGNEMQMNKKGLGQENIMGMYSGNNFNVW